MTAPEEKATFNPLLRLSAAALAVRALAAVAIFMPMKPARAEYTPPVRKAKGMNQLSRMFKAVRTSSRRNTTANTLDTVRYWCFR